MKRVTQLKVKIKTLASEAGHIRLEETRTHGALRCDLADHRRGVVRREARCSLLAYGFLRGRPYLTIEAENTRVTPSWPKIGKMVERFGVQREPEEPDEAFKARVAAQAAALKAWRPG